MTSSDFERLMIHMVFFISSRSYSSKYFVRIIFRIFETKKYKKIWRKHYHCENQEERINMKKEKMVKSLSEWRKHLIANTHNAEINCNWKKKYVIYLIKAITHSNALEWWWDA